MDLRIEIKVCLQQNQVYYYGGIAVVGFVRNQSDVMAAIS